MAVFVLVALYVFVNRRKPTGYATGREVLLIDLAHLLYLGIVLMLLLKAPATW